MAETVNPPTIDVHSKNLRRIADALDKFALLASETIANKDPTKNATKGPEMIEALHTIAASVEDLKAALVFVESLQGARSVLEQFIRSWS